MGRSCVGLIFGMLALVSSGCQMFSAHPAPPGTDLAPSMAPIKSTRVDQSSPETAKLRFAAAQQMELAGNAKEAIALYENARQVDPRYREAATRRLAVLYDKAGDFDKARAEFEQTLRIHPNDPDALNNLGYAYYCRGQWTLAEETLRKAVAANPQHQCAWINLGLTLAQQDRPEQSLEAFTRVVSPAQGHCNLAFVLMTQGKRDEAKEAYRAALRLDPSLQLAQTALAKLEGSVAREGAPEKASMTQRRTPPPEAPNVSAPILDETPIVVDPALAEPSVPRPAP